MSDKNRHSLPFDSEDFDFSRFEAFVTSILSLGHVLPLGVEGAVVKSPKIFHRYGKQGDAQRGIDIKGQIDGGRSLVVQCKYHDPKTKKGRVTLGDAKKAVEKAESEHPEADHYVLVTNIAHNDPKAVDFIEAKDAWDFWGGQQLHQIVRGLPLEKGWHLVVDHFGVSVAREFFPLGPGVYMCPKEYQKMNRGTLSHAYDCVGRESENKKIVKPLTAKKSKVVLVSGDGGVGKSRLFLEVLQEVYKQDSGIEVRIAEPDTGGDWGQLGLIGDGPLVIGLDDCQISGRLDAQFLTLARSRPDTRLLLMTRPGSLDQVRHQLRASGWGEMMVEPLGDSGLKPLNKPAMRKLAREIIGHDHEDIPLLVDWSDGNALFTVVGAESIRDKKMRIRHLVNAESFKKVVFETLRDQITSERDDKDRALRIAGLMALLSPFSMADYPEAAAILDTSQFELVDELNRMEKLGLARLSNERGRIIPDLFSDYLVNELLGSSGSQILLRRLTQSGLFKQENTSVFKNLAMADWCRHLEDAEGDTLTEPLWHEFREVFEKADDREKDEMLKRWADFGLYLPQKSLELCDLVRRLDPMPPENPFWDDNKNTEFYRDRLVRSSVGLLVEIAKNHAAHQDAALDRLWEVDGIQDEPFNIGGDDALGLVTSFEENQTIESVLGALKWFDDKIGDSETRTRFTAEKSDLMQRVLGGVFASQIEKNIWEGRSMQFWSVPIHIENTSECRSLGFDILERVALSGEMGASNCLSLLARVAAKPSSLIGGRAQAKSFHSEWNDVRLRALDIIERVIDQKYGAILSFLVREKLRVLEMRRNDDAVVQNRIRELLAKIENFEELSRLIVILSDRYSEYRRRAVDEDKEEQRRKEIENWEGLVDGVCSDFLGGLETAEVVAGWCQEIYDRLEAYDLNPNFYELFEGVMRQRPEFAEQLRQYVLRNKENCLDGYYVQFSLWLRNEDDADRDKMLSEGVSLDRPVIMRSIISALQYRVIEYDFPRTKVFLGRTLSEASGERVNQALSLAGHVHTEEMIHLVFENLPWSKLGGKHFKWLGERFNKHGGAHLMLMFPKRAMQLMFQRLEELPFITIQEVSDLVVYACRETPEIAFEFFDKRVEFAEEQSGRPYVFPLVLEGFAFGDLSQVKNLDHRLEEILIRATSDQDLESVWNDWLTIILSGQTGLEEKMLARQIEKLEGVKQMVGFVSRQMNLRQVLEMPGIIDLILARAKALGSDEYQQIEDELYYRVVSHGQSYTNGVPQETWYLDEALKQQEKNRGNDRLFRLYDRIVKYERGDAERHRRIHAEDINRGEEFS